MSRLFVTLLATCAILTFADAAMQCFSCNSADKSNCEPPEVKTENCDNDNSICLSLILRSTKRNTDKFLRYCWNGKGCDAIYKDDQLQEKLYCKECQDDLCNDDQFPDPNEA